LVFWAAVEVLMVAPPGFRPPLSSGSELLEAGRNQLGGPEPVRRFTLVIGKMAARTFDGKTEAWAFTQIDRSVSGGTVVRGRLWRRPSDNIGVAAVRNYLSGDGRLHYARSRLWKPAMLAVSVGFLRVRWEW
jgi:hypothetical protein